MWDVGREDQGGSLLLCSVCPVSLLRVTALGGAPLPFAFSWALPDLQVIPLTFKQHRAISSTRDARGLPNKHTLF